jgi:hypothetical protein
MHALVPAAVVVEMAVENGDVGGHVIVVGDDVECAYFDRALDSYSPYSIFQSRAIVCLVLAKKRAVHEADRSLD